MFNHEKYRAIQAELFEFLKDEKDIDKGIEFYCKQRKLIFFKEWVFDDWKNEMGLRIINDEKEGLHIILVELPFEAEFMTKYKEGRGAKLWQTR